jgi:ABC-type glutathione transport system ATPase component
MKPKTVLSVRDLRKIYPGKQKSFVAVDGVSFDLEEGEILGLLGPNGAGDPPSRCFFRRLNPHPARSSILVGFFYTSFGNSRACGLC